MNGVFRDPVGMSFAAAKNAGPAAESRGSLNCKAKPTIPWAKNFAAVMATAKRVVTVRVDPESKSSSGFGFLVDLIDGFSMIGETEAEILDLGLRRRGKERFWCTERRWIGAEGSGKEAVGRRLQPKEAMGWCRLRVIWVAMREEAIFHFGSSEILTFLCFFLFVAQNGRMTY